MKKFINIETGNVVRAKNAATIALMEKSSAYKEVTGKAAKAGKGAADDKKADNKGAADDEKADNKGVADDEKADSADGGNAQ